MPNCVTIWLAWLANHAAFLDVRMRSNVLYDYSCIVSTAGNFTSNVFQIMFLT